MHGRTAGPRCSTVRRLRSEWDGGAADMAWSGWSEHLAAGLARRLVLGDDGALARHPRGRDPGETASAHRDTSRDLDQPLQPEIDGARCPGAGRRRAVNGELVIRPSSCGAATAPDPDADDSACSAPPGAGGRTLGSCGARCGTGAGASGSRACTLVRRTRRSAGRCRSPRSRRSARPRTGSSRLVDWYWFTWPGASAVHRTEGRPASSIGCVPPSRSGRPKRQEA